MSRTFFLACPETKLRLWIGQGHGDISHPHMEVLYCENGEDKVLCNFLNKHARKHLLFVDSEDPLFDQFDYTDYGYPI